MAGIGAKMMDFAAIDPLQSRRRELRAGQMPLNGFGLGLGHLCEPDGIIAVYSGFQGQQLLGLFMPQ
jgi:hypothetical protein